MLNHCGIRDTAILSVADTLFRIGSIVSKLLFLSRKRKKVYMKKQNYYLAIRDEYVVLELKNGMSVDYFTYNNDFIRILNEWHITPFNNSGRLQCDCWKSRRSEAIKLYLYDLAYACYAYMVHAESFTADWQKYLDWKNNRGLEVDHADNNTHNNTDLNLSLMPCALNRSKRRLTASFVPPYYLNSIFLNGEYRVQILCDVARDYLGNMLSDFGVEKIGISSNGRAAMHFLCESAESYLACLQRLWDSRFDWCNPESTPREHAKRNGDLKYWAENINHSLQAQKVLSQMKKSEFQKYGQKSS